MKSLTPPQQFWSLYYCFSHYFDQTHNFFSILPPKRTCFISLCFPTTNSNCLPLHLLPIVVILVSDTYCEYQILTLHYYAHPGQNTCKYDIGVYCTSLWMFSQLLIDLVLTLLYKVSQTTVQSVPDYCTGCPKLLCMLSQTINPIKLSVHWTFPVSVTKTYLTQNSRHKLKGNVCVHELPLPLIVLNFGVVLNSPVWMFNLSYLKCTITATFGLDQQIAIKILTYIVKINH